MSTAVIPRSGARRVQIVAEAADLFAARGFAAVTVQEIAERSGISAGAIYRHFPSKEAVLSAVLRDAIDAWVLAAEAARERTGGTDALRAVVEAAVRLTVDRPGLLATYLRERHRADGPTRRAIRGRESQLAAQWNAAMLEHRQDLSRSDLVIRQHAVNGVLGSLASRPEVLAAPRARALVTESLLAVAGAPPFASGDRPADPPRRWEPPVSRRRQILSTAISLFSTHGYHGVGLDEVGDAMGIAGPSIYEYFATKSDILLDAYDYAGSLVVAGAADALSNASSARDALERLAASFIQTCFAQHELITVTSREGAALPPAERPRLSRRRRELHETWAAVLRQERTDISAGEALLLVRCMVPLVLQVARNRRRGVDLVAATVALASAFLAGAGDASQTRPVKES